MKSVRLAVPLRDVWAVQLAEIDFGLWSCGSLVSVADTEGSQRKFRVLTANWVEDCPHVDQRCATECLVWRVPGQRSGTGRARGQRTSASTEGV